MVLLFIVSVTMGCSYAAEPSGLSAKPYSVETMVYDTDTNYMAVMMNRAEEGAESARMLDAISEESPNMKIPEAAGEEPHCYSEEEVVMTAKVLYRECGGVPSDTEKACVAWTVCNRVDMDGFPNTIQEVIEYPGAFAYSPDTPVTEELYALALDVLGRWNAEKNGDYDTGRVLPKDYAYFSGDGEHNYFRNAFCDNYDIWDYSLGSPYES